MKVILVFLSALLLQQTAFAKKGDIPSEADYVVPTTPDLVPYSRFKVKIQQAYSGDTSDTIAYEFPADLTGIEGQIITLKRIPNTNEWEAPEMTASCTESNELFSCNIYLVKTEEPISDEASFQSVPFLNNTIAKSSIFAKANFSGCGGSVQTMSSFVKEENVSKFLTGSGFKGDVFDKKMSVAKAFACSEPAGILSYEFK